MSTADALDTVEEARTLVLTDDLDLTHASIPTSKRVLDVVVATSLLVVTAPLLLVVALVVRLDGGPALFAQRRIGQGGRIIEIKKFRSMAVNAEERLYADPDLHARYVANGFKLPENADPRLTRWGRFLRSSSLDELPQLVSVLRGDLSMVGPRPIVEPELVEYAKRDAVAVYLGTRPGLTGLWQVSGRSAVKYEQRVILDRRYLAERSLWVDAKIIARTALVVLRRVGAH